MAESNVLSSISPKCQRIRELRNGGEGGIRTHVPHTGQDAFEAPPLRPLRYLSVGENALDADLQVYRIGHLAEASRADATARARQRTCLACGAAGQRRTRKNSCISSRHAASRTPDTTANR